MSSTELLILLILPALICFRAGRGRSRNRVLGAMVLLLSLAPASASASHGERDFWKNCSKTAGNKAARSAGLTSALNRDKGLRRVFPDVRPSKFYKRPSTSLCADYNRDGRLDRAVHYQCCTGSSPAPWVLLKGTRKGYRIAYKRLSDTTFKLSAFDDLTLRTLEPRYARTDGTCCPSQYRIGELRWDGRRFRRTFSIEDA